MEWAIGYVAIVLAFIAWGKHRARVAAYEIAAENEQRILRARAVWGDCLYEIHVDDDGLIRYVAPVDDRPGSIRFGPLGSMGEIVND